ncbi:hypothetical protein KC887_03595 [Candidatus Kaiserbacteria bacterium]|nr:hypothetical protein [Candidatus Kaiserbacteria bacterium]
MEREPNKEVLREPYSYDQGLLERGIKELIFDRGAAFSIAELNQIIEKEFPGQDLSRVYLARGDDGESLTMGVE